MSKPGVDPSSGTSSEDVLRLTERHPAYRRREAQPGSRAERENLDGDAKGKGTSGANREAESTDAPARGGLLRSSDEAGVMPVERREQAIAIWLGSTGNGRNPMVNGRRQPSSGGTSRMMREYQVRICEGLGVSPELIADLARRAPATKCIPMSPGRSLPPLSKVRGWPAAGCGRCSPHEMREPQPGFHPGYSRMAAQPQSCLVARAAPSTREPSLRKATPASILP